MEWKSNPFFKSTFSPERHGSTHVDDSSVQKVSHSIDMPGDFESPQQDGTMNRVNPTYEPWLEREGNILTNDGAPADKEQRLEEEIARTPIHMREYNGGAAAAAIGSDRPEEERFEQTVRRLVTREISVSDGLQAFREICTARADALRDLAASQVEQTPQYHALMEDAHELECEASTWNLLWFLFAIEDASFPAGKGGDFVHGAGMCKTMRQHAADAVFQDIELNRAARVVAWLEAEAREKDVEPDQGLGRKDGLWRETKSVLDGTATSRFGQAGSGLAGVTHLDPDSMIRENGSINGDNAKDEERLSKVIWRLLRSGRLHQAARVCEYAGQPWRAASITGYGMYGPLPLGEAADEADSHETGIYQSETLASEIELGASSKMLWRWACHAAARKIAASVEQAGHGLYESAVYAVLSGDIEKAVPACSSWHDLLWVYMRCWLEYRVDLNLVEKNTAILDAVHGTQGLERKSRECDVYEEKSLADAGISIPPHDWPIQAISKQIPDDLAGAVIQGSTESGTINVSPEENQKRFRSIQVNLMLGHVESLLEGLIEWIIPGGSPEEAQNCPPALMRFSAHISLLLWSLNLVDIEADGVSPLYSKINDGLQKLVWIYVVHLIDSASYSLVPAYLVHLRLGLRRMTTQLLLEQTTYHESISDRKKIHVLCSQWFQRYTDVEGFAPDEVWVSVSQFCDKARETAFGGPSMRAESVAWLFFGGKYIEEAIHRSVFLCRDFSLGGLQGAVAALQLLKEIIPKAADCEDGLPTLLSRNAATDDVRELASWEKYFEIVREYCLWEEVYARAIEEVLETNDNESRHDALQGLVNDSKYLFDGILEFILVEGDGWVVSSGENVDTQQATLVLAPAEDNPLDPNLVEYPVFPEDVILKACSLIDDHVAPDIGETLSFETGKAGADMPGLIYLRIWADIPDKKTFEDTVTRIFCNLLKNGISYGSDTLSFMATNIIGPISISSKVCQSMCLPQLVLQIAVLREALAYMGLTSSLDDANAVIEKGVQGWDGLFSEAQKNQIASLEQSGTELLANNLKSNDVINLIQ